MLFTFNQFQSKFYKYKPHGDQTELRIQFQNWYLMVLYQPHSSISPPTKHAHRRSDFEIRPSLYGQIFHVSNYGCSPLASLELSTLYKNQNPRESLLLYKNKNRTHSRSTYFLCFIILLAQNTNA